MGGGRGSGVAAAEEVEGDVEGGEKYSCRLVCRVATMVLGSQTICQERYHQLAYIEVV